MLSSLIQNTATALSQNMSNVFDISQNKEKLQYKNVYKALKQQGIDADEFLNSLKQPILKVEITNDNETNENKANAVFKDVISSLYISKGTNVVENWILSENQCTDGNDDGKISFMSKVTNVIEGVGKSIVSTMYNVVTNPKRLIKTVCGGLILAAMASNPITAIPVIALGVFTGVNLLKVGVKTIHDASKEAKVAEKDAEAKDAYEKVGQGLLEVFAGGLSCFQSFNLARTTIPQLPKTVGNACTRAKEIIKKPVSIIEDIGDAYGKINVENVDKVVTESLLDIANIEDDI